MLDVETLAEILSACFAETEHGLPDEAPPGPWSNFAIGEDLELEITEDEARLMIWLQRHEGDQLNDISGVPVRLPMRGMTEARWGAYWRGLLDGSQVLFKHADARLGEGVSGDEILKVHARLLLDDRCQTLAQFTERTADLALFDVLDATYRGFLATARPEPRAEVMQRRAAAHEAAMIEFPPAAARFFAAHGFRLSKQLALMSALLRSLSATERAAFDAVFAVPADVAEASLARLLGPSPVAPAWCTDGAPPELLTVFDHSRPRVVSRYGMFYDDPARPPSGWANFGYDKSLMPWRRDSYELIWSAATLFDLLRQTFGFDFDHAHDDIYGQPHYDGSRGETPEAVQATEHRNHQSRLICEALDDFAEHERAINAEECPELPGRMAGANWSERRGLAVIASSEIGIATDAGDAEDVAYLQQIGDLQALWFSDRTQLDAWIAEADTALADGDPRYALALGRDLLAAGDRGVEQTDGQWFADGESAAIARRLLTAAYRALGRHALATIAERIA